MVQSVTRWLLVAGLGLCLPARAAVEEPAVSRQIPAEAVFVVFAAQPDQLVQGADALLSRFKFLNPELDLAAQGEKIREQVGENLLTRAGLEAFGVDADGVLAVYATGVQNDQQAITVIPLKDPKLFREKLSGLMEKFSGGAPLPKPRRVGTSEVIDAGENLIAFGGPFCLVVEKGDRKGAAADAPIKAFFGRGRKLAGEAHFKDARSALPDGSRLWTVWNMKRLATELDASLKQMSANIARMKGITPAQRKEMQSEIDNMRREQAQILAAVKFIGGMAFALAVDANRVDLSGYLSAAPAGLPVMKAIFPSVPAPTFGETLQKSAVLGGWFSFDLSSFVRQMGNVPAEGGRTLQQQLDEANRNLKSTLKLDLFKDILGTFQGPWAFYLLPPAAVTPEKGEEAGQVAARMLRLVAAVRVSNGARFALLLPLLAQGAGGAAAPTPGTIGKASVLTFPAGGTTLTLGVMDDLLFVAVGQGVAETFVNGLGEPHFGTAGADIAGARLDIASLGEAATSLLNGPLGEQAGEFKAAWPLVQAVLGQMTAVSSSAKMLPNGVQFSAALDLRK
ncbi:MAG: hypothetical protein GYA21_14945 [Myxococcales bacterium]|nr:hypothetical protein [Myxococcales bacterium]